MNRMKTTLDLEALAQEPMALEFDRRGITAINIDDVVFISLSRIWGLQIQPGGHAKTHLVDYILTNELGTSQGQIFSYWEAQGKIFSCGVPFDIAPGVNQLELIVYDINNPESRQSLFFQFSIDGRIYRKGNAVFILADHTGSYSNEFLDRIAQNVSMLQSYVPGLHNILTFKLQDFRYGLSAVRKYLRKPYIEIACFEGQERETESTMIHEKAHEFYDNISDPERLELVAEFEEFYSRNMRNGGFGKKRFGERIAGETPTWYDKGSVFGVFMERYYAGQSKGAGHPWDGPEELFASATAILATHNEEFFEKIRNLRTEGERNLAKEVMVKVLRIYELYCKTGTQLFQ